MVGTAVLFLKVKKLLGSTLTGEPASGETQRQTDCVSSLRVAPIADMSLFQYPVDQVEDEVVYKAGDVVEIEIGIRHQPESSADLFDPVLGSVLPEGMSYVPNSWYFVDQSSEEITQTASVSDTEGFVPLFTPPRPLFTESEGRNGTTVLRWIWRDVSALSLPFEFGGENPAVRIRFQAAISETNARNLPPTSHIR